MVGIEAVERWEEGREQRAVRKYTEQAEPEAQGQQRVQKEAGYPCLPPVSACPTACRTQHFPKLHRLSNRWASVSFCFYYD